MSPSITDEIAAGAFGKEPKLKVTPWLFGPVLSVIGLVRLTNPNSRVVPSSIITAGLVPVTTFLPKAWLFVTTTVPSLIVDPPV